MRICLTISGLTAPLGWHVVGSQSRYDPVAAAFAPLAKILGNLLSERENSEYDPHLTGQQ